MEEIKFCKIREVKSPSRAYKYDAGIDFYVPKFNKEFIKDLKEKNSFFITNEESYCNTHSDSILTISSSNNSSRTVWDMNDNGSSIIHYDEESGKNYFLLVPGSGVNIPSGIKVRMSNDKNKDGNQNNGKALIAFNKSGIATKYGLIAGACVIDYSYMGEIHLNVINTSTKVVRIYEDMKILQFIEVPIYCSEISVTEFDEKSDEYIHFYQHMPSDRKESGFGSTDKK
ncbi:hypothetical protein M0Q50_05955 [bacterium]|jgi:dUTPase|nr:hypothetical protein [bacterium]